MKRIIIILAVFFVANSLRAQQIPHGPNTIMFTPKELLPGMYGKAFTLSSFVDNGDSLTKAFVTIYLVDSSGTTLRKNIQQIYKNFQFPTSSFPNHPPTREDVITKVAEALHVQIIH